MNASKVNSNMNKSKRRMWGDNEVAVFVKSWKDHVYMNHFIKKGCNKNPLYFAISKDLLKEGYNRTAREIMFKMDNLTRHYRRTKKFGPKPGISDVKWCNKVEEILELEKNTNKPKQLSESQMDQAMELIYGPYIAGNVPAPVRQRVYRTKDEEDSDSDLLSYSVIKPAESEVSNNSQRLLHLSSINFKKTTENILLEFCREFERSNRQLEKNDATILELFREQNAIFRTQTTLIKNLLSK